MNYPNGVSTFILTLCMALLTAAQSFAFQIEGRITSEEGEGLAFATIHQKNTTHGTTSNAQGYYSLEVTGDSVVLVFQYVGYQSVEKFVYRSDDAVVLNISMKPELVTLEAVVVKPGVEDPAYQIIRQAIDNRKKHLGEIQDYRCEVYIKGMQRLDQVPEKVLGIPVAIDTGIVYLSESVSELSFKQPDLVKERVISSKVSGDNQAFSFNQASDMLISFYDNQIYAEGLSERSFISPIADNAMMFYDYELLGVAEEDDRLINKIRVIPKRAHDPAFSGEIYIVEDSWRIHSTNLLLTKNHQIEFVDSLRVRQVLAPVRQGEALLWAPISQQFEFLLNTFGFKGHGYFVGVYKDYKINEGFNRKYFSNEIIRVEPQSNLKDSSYWQLTRPIPLTKEEISDYRVKDSLQNIKESKTYLDSVDVISNKITPVNILVTGKTIRNSYKKTSWNFPPLHKSLQYNTVEGFVPYLRFRYTQRFEDYRFYNITPEARYGFSNERFNARLNARYYYNPLKVGSVRFSAGRFVEQLNEESPLQPFDNTAYTLLLEKNYLKIYEKLHLSLSHDSEIINGVYLDGSIEWTQRNPLVNTTDYSFRDNSERTFTPNAPENEDLGDTSFEKHQAFLVSLKVRWQPGQKYIRRPYRKFIIRNELPTFALSFVAGIPDLFGSDLDYQRLAGTITHDFKLGLIGSGYLAFEAGGFINKDSLSFVDFKHFNGNRTIFGHFEVGNYQLLDYYRYSTRKVYYQGHYEHHFNGFVFNKIPFLRKTRIQAVSAINYLHTAEGASYWELGLGIEHIFKILRIDYYNSWRAGNHERSGIRLGVGF